MKTNWKFGPTEAIAACLTAWFLYWLFFKPTHMEQSYAALSEIHQKLADDCLKTIGVGRGLDGGEYRTSTLQALDNELDFNKWGGYRRILVRVSGDRDFFRCDYKWKSGERLKAERIVDGKTTATY